MDDTEVVPPGLKQIFVNIVEGRAVSRPFILFLCSGMAYSATRTWDGSYSIYWSASANWAEGVTPQSGDTLVFPETAGNKSNYNNLGSRTFNKLLFSGSGYTLTESAISLTEGINASAAGSSNTIDLNIKLTEAQQFNASSSTATLYVNGDVNLDSYTLTLYGSGTVSIGGES